MTRIEKYKTLRTQIVKDIKENTKIWQQEQKIVTYRQILSKIDKEYFEPIFNKLNDNLNLINFENHFIKNHEQYLQSNDKLLLEKMLENINNTLAQYTSNVVTQPFETLVTIPNLEYQTLINGMHTKISEFQKNLESKIYDVEKFIKNLEFRYKKYKLNSNEFMKYLTEIQSQYCNFHDTLQKLKPKTNYKASLLIFSIIIICLVLVVVLLLLLIVVVK